MKSDWLRRTEILRKLWLAEVEIPFLKREENLGEQKGMYEVKYRYNGSKEICTHRKI